MKSKRPKRFMIFAILAVALLLSLVSCGSEGKEKTSETEPSFSEFQWPKSDIAALLSVPKSNIGHVDWETSYGFVIYVADTSKEDYDAYVDDCWGRGFTMNYSKGDDYFWADNKDGYKVTVRLDEGDVMFIRMDNPPDDFESTETDKVNDNSSSGQDVPPTLTETQVATPLSSADCVYENYLTIVPQFEQAGFTDVRTEAVPDLLNGWLTGDGDVKEVLIGDESGFAQYEIFEKNTPVIIRYHTFPEPEPSGNIQEPTEAPVADDILTVDNCEDLASMLVLKAEIDPAYSAFAQTYKGRTIEFDGCITYIVNHENYNTRYDLLLSAGDYVNENTANPGPIFKFEDVNTSDMGIEDLFLPEFVKVGSNVHIKAKVIKFDCGSGLFFLDPMLVEESVDIVDSDAIDKWIGKE